MQQPEWVKRFIDSVIFLSPSFAGFPSSFNLLSQTFRPFKSNAEFKKSLMRMTGIHMSLPNHVVYENFSLNYIRKVDDESENLYLHNVSQVFEFLKDLKKVDDESEKIYKSVAEKYLKVPIPEPPIPSIILISKETSETEIKPIISINHEDRHDEAVSISSLYACSHWKSTKCVKSNNFSQFIFKYLKNHSSTRNHIVQKEKKTIKTFDNNDHIEISGVKGVYANNGYVNAHAVSSTQYSFTGPEGKPKYPLTNAFDQSTRTIYISNVVNSENYNNTLEITFNEAISLEAFLYDTGYITSGNTRVYHGFPTLLYAYTSLGENSPYNLSGIFEGTPVYPDTRVQFVFNNYIDCDRLKLVFVEVTDQTLDNGPAKNPVICGMLFLRHLYISGESIYSTVGYVNARTIPNSEFSYTASEGLDNYPIANAFDEDSTTYYISKTANSETNKNFVEINFDKTEILESFLFDQIVLKIDDIQVIQGNPSVMNVYASKGNDPYSLQMKINGPSNPEWNRVCYHFKTLIECDKLKIEFVEVSSQTIVGNSTNVVFSGLYFNRYVKETRYTTTNFNYSADGYLVTYSVSPTKFVYSGDAGKASNPLSNAFDGNTLTFYIPNSQASTSSVNTITVEFSETVSLIDIVYELAISTNNGMRTYIGYPSYINIYASLGNDPFSLRQIFYGHPISPTTKVQFHFDDVIRCDKMKLEFYEISSANLYIGNLFFIPVHESNIVPIVGANSTYLDSAYINSNVVDNSKFTFTIDEPYSTNYATNMFNGNSETYYLSNIVINLTYHIEMEINFSEQVILNAFLIDSQRLLSGTIGLYRGFPTGVKVYSSLDGSPYDLKAFFIGDPTYPHLRFQFVFPDVVRCDKLKLEFVHAKFFVHPGNRQTNQLCIVELYLMQTIIPPSATPTPSPSFSPTYSPTSSPSFSPTSSPSFSPTASPSFSPTYSPSFSPTASSSFSPTRSISPSSSPKLSTTPSFSPSFSPSKTIFPSQDPISNVCQPGTHCSYEGSIDNQFSVTIKFTNFSSIRSTENGGAFFLKNIGLNCTDVTFSGCQTKKSQSGSENTRESGGGGGIYIKNEIETSNPILLDGVNFTNCKAEYGGALYLFSSSSISTITIINCYFLTNQATSTSSSSSHFSGGSAIFITSKDSYISDCTFNKNIGESQLKIENVFNQTRNEKNSILSQSRPKTSNVIKYCKFVIEKKSKTSLYYMTAENGVVCFLMNSVFVGELMPGNYHINGNLMTQNAPKLVVVGCKFSSGHSRACTSDSDNKYIIMQFQKQTFDYTEDFGEDENYKNIFGYSLFGVAAVLIIVIILVLKFNSK